MNQPKNASNKATPLTRPLSLLFAGFLAGVANGLLGAGGGILAVFGLQRTYKDALAPQDLYANALCIMLPLSLFSCLHYAKAGNLDLLAFAPFALPSILGGIVGAILLCRISKRLLSRLFGSLVIWSGVLLIIR